MPKAVTHCLIVAGSDKRITEHAYLDVTTTDPVEILADMKANIIWVHVNGRPIFRICQPGGRFELIDVTSSPSTKYATGKRGEK